jgi:DNA-binding IclR family transcriptional regulator
LREIFGTLHWDNPLSFDEWLRQVEQTRTQGFAVDKGNYISGVIVVLAPVWETTSDLGHALIAFGIGEVMKRERLRALQASLLRESQTLTNQLQGGAA